MSKIIVCRYECGTELGDFDEKENKYREPRTGILHTKERCEFMKSSLQKFKKVETKKEWEPTPEAKAWIREIMEGPKIKELDDRLRRVEAILFKVDQKK